MKNSRLFLCCIHTGLLILATAAGCSTRGQSSQEKSNSAASTESKSGKATSPAESTGDFLFVGDSQLTIDQQAVVAFDFKINELLNSDLVEGFVSDEMLELHGLLKKRDLANFKLVRRITGCIADTDRPDHFFPKTGTDERSRHLTEKKNSYRDEKDSVAEPTNREVKPTVPDFWFEIEFSEVNFVQTQLMGDLNLDEPVELFGKSFYQSPEMKALDIFVLPVDAKTMQFGTRGYFQYQSANLVTQNLAKLWNQTPGDAPLRVVVDGQGSVRAASGIADWFSSGAPEFLKEYVDLLRLRADIVFKVDPSDPQMISLDVNAGNVAGANRVLATFRKLHVLLETVTTPMITKGLKDFPEDAAVLKQLVDSLRPTVSDSTVSVRLQKPFEFEKRLRNSLARGKRNIDRRSEMYRFHSIGLAIEDFRQTYRGQDLFGKGRKNFHDNLSWRVVAMSGLFGNIRVQYDASKAWNDPANRELIRSMPRDYGTGGMNTKIVHVQRQTAKVSKHAIMLMESTNPVPWTMPIDIDVQKAIKNFCTLKPGESLFVMTYDRVVYDICKRLDRDDAKRLFSDDLTEAELERIVFD